MTEPRDDGAEAVDDLILDLLDARPGAVGDPARAPRAAREYIELLGILPRALPEIAPGDGVRERILEEVGRETELRRSAPAPLVSAPARRRPGWLMPLAASLAVAMVAVTAWLVVQVRDQRVLIAELSQELEGSRAMAEALAASRAQLAEARSRLAMATTRGAEFCALTPPEGSPAAGALGVVVMHAGRDEWFLRIEGLAPCPAGRVYTVWFATPSGSVPGPVFVAKGGEAVELSITDRPEEIRAIMITLESEPDARTPSMEPLLFGNERIKLL